MPRIELPPIAILSRRFGLWPARAEPRPLLRAIRAGVGLLPIAGASFELVGALQVLEHLPEPVVAFAELRRALRVAGQFGPNRIAPFNHNDSTGFAGKELHS